MLQELSQAISNSTELPIQDIESALTRTKEIRFGDYAFPCFLLAKMWKLSPPECAKKLQGIIALPKSIERAEAVGPYVNFFLNRTEFSKCTLRKIIQEKYRVGAQPANNLTVIVEHSSTNIAKPFHIGHLRTTLIGYALDRIYRHCGYHVIAINHLGDWGTQFGFVHAGCEIWGKPQNPSVEDLVDLYKKATALKAQQEEGTVPSEDSDKPDTNTLAREYFLKLEAGDTEAVNFWKWCLDISLEYFKKMYDRLGVHFDHYIGESFYRSMLGDVETSLKKSGILEESKGARGVDLGKKLGFARIFTPDGRSLYLTRDIASSDYREKTFHPYKILHVVGAPQILYFQQLIGVLQKWGHPTGTKLVHIPFGHITGLSTRKSAGDERISLLQLLDEAHERALATYTSEVTKRPEGLDENVIAESVGLGAIFFHYLCRSNIKDFNFKWEDALNFHGDSGPYIQYALARLNSIEAKAKEQGICIDEDFDPKYIADDDSYALVSLLSKFPDIVKKSAEDYEPYHIAQYLLTLTQLFSSLYKKLRVIGEEEQVAKARLALFIATRNVIYTGLGLIGVPQVERM